MTARYKLNNWALINCGTSKGCLMGIVKGHPEWEDGRWLVTSNLRGRNGNLIVTSSGSCIELGEPSKDYESLFPDAKRRLMNALSHSLIALDEGVGQ